MSGIIYEEGRNELYTLYFVLRNYYRKISPIERVFYMSSVIYVFIYTLLFLLYLVSIERLYLSPLLVFPIISVIVTVSN